jgi:hypothetical protein
VDGVCVGPGDEVEGGWDDNAALDGQRQQDDEDIPPQHNSFHTQMFITRATVTLSKFFKKYLHFLSTYPPTFFTSRISK